MSEQRVHITNNEVGCGAIIVAVALLFAMAATATSLCKRLESIERAIRNEPRLEKK